MLEQNISGRPQKVKSSTFYLTYPCYTQLQTDCFIYQPKTWQYIFSSFHENRHTTMQPETGTQTKASSSRFSLHSDVSVPFIFRPQRLTRFHDVAALLSLICFCCPLHHSISIRAVLARGCELGCVIWFRAEREHLFYKAFAPSVPRASWKKTKPAVGQLLQLGTIQTWKSQQWVQILSRIISAMREEEWQLFEMEGSNVWSHVGFTIGLTMIKDTLYWFHMYSRRSKHDDKVFHSASLPTWSKFIIGNQTMNSHDIKICIYKSSGLHYRFKENILLWKR